MNLHRSNNRRHAADGCVTLSYRDHHQHAQTREESRHAEFRKRQSLAQHVAQGFRSHAEVRHGQDRHQRQDEHDVVQQQVAHGGRLHSWGASHEDDGRQIHLAGAERLQDRHEEAYAQRADNQAASRKTGSDHLVDAFLDSLGQAERHLLCIAGADVADGIDQAPASQGEGQDGHAAG